MKNKPLPPESTTPACLRTGSSSGVFCTEASAAGTTRSRISIGILCLRSARLRQRQPYPSRRSGWCPPPGGQHPCRRCRALPRSPFTSVGPSRISAPCRPRENPRHNWERITPELPRAPIKRTFCHRRGHLAHMACAELGDLVPGRLHGQRHVGAGVAIRDGENIQRS